MIVIVFIWLVGHGKQSDVLDSCSKVLQITNDGEWVDGRIGAGVALEVNGSNKFPYSVIPDNVANDCFDKFNVETNTLQRNDIYLVEYGVNNDKAKIFTYPHSDRSESKVQATTKPYSNLSITKLVEKAHPLRSCPNCTPCFIVFSLTIKILLTPCFDSHFRVERESWIRTDGQVIY